jgi:riboflavin kinase/FMN adenylyltransferase
LYLQFDEEMVEMRAEEFLRRILIEKVKAKEIVFGYDCHFGYRREGDYHFLKDNENFYGYRSSLIKPVRIKGKIVSSSLIRNMIRAGEVTEAEKFLGRYYDLIGTVGTGSGIGRELGFPTLNVIPIDSFKLLPANGVYFGKACFAEQEHFCLTNIGYCPTLKHLDERTVETHLIGFEGDLYNRKISISFITRLRDEEKFSDKNSLQRAIEKDRQVADKLIERIEKR